jgi:hypothetical protein
MNNRFGLTFGFDVGAQQKSKNSTEYNTWYSPVVIARFSLNDKLNLAVRGEYYGDKNGVIIGTGTPNGFKTFGYSANFDYKISDLLLWRIEARGFSSKDEIFNLDQKPSRVNYFVTSSFAISF